MRSGKRCHSMPGTPCPILQVDCTFIITVQAATCRNPLAQKQFLYAKSNLALHTFGGCFSILTCAQDCLDLHATGAPVVFLPLTVQMEPSGPSATTAHLLAVEHSVANATACTLNSQSAGAIILKYTAYVLILCCRVGGIPVYSGVVVGIYLHVRPTGNWMPTIP